MSRWKKILLCIIGGVLLLLLLIGSQVVCLSAWIRYGVLIPECADGEMKLGVTLDASSLRRGSWGTVEVGAIAHYTTGPADYAQSASVGRSSAKVFLLNGTEKTELKPDEDGWQDAGYGDRKVAQIMLPKELPDGEYRLRAEVDTPLGEGSVEAPLLVFAPAVVHVITDRPLYEAGNTIRFRAVVLRARDLSPLDGRPGRWIVTDPEGQVVLEENAPAGEFGVAAGDFPLDEGAPSGAWRVRWESGAASDEVTVQVEPFTLPRFSVEASAVKSFYRSGERPRLRGRVVYSSGAPVAGADVEIAWSVAGEWPPPPSWTSGGLPERTSAEKNGEFEVTLPEVPKDLRGRVTLNARIAAIDPAGDRVEGSASILLSEDAIAVDSITELGDGLAEGFNNRVFLRVTTAAGAVLPETNLLVKRTWDPTDPGVSAVTDEDGVAVLQLDPGPAVNVVIPPMPVRPPPRPKPVQRTHVEELIEGEVRLADQVALDRMNALLEPCVRFVPGESDGVQVSLWVDPSGAVRGAASAKTPLGQCFARVLRAQKLGPGAERIYRIDYRVSSDLPSVDAQTVVSYGDASRLDEALVEPMLDARGCLPEDVEEASFPRLMTFRIEGDRLETRWTRDRSADRIVPASIASCVESRLSKLELKKRVRSAEEEEEGDAVDAVDAIFGFVRLSVRPGLRYLSDAAQETVMLGYEMTVEASAKDGETLGKTKVRWSPSDVPDLRLRPSKVLAQPGDTIELTFIRGPSFTGELPKKLYLRHEQKELEAEVNEETRTASFTLPAELDGWFESSWGGARALIYVRPRSELSVSVTPDRDRYRPRDRAELTVRTVANERPTPAAVTLIGVDQSLAQLVPLPGPDDMARVRPKVSMSDPAFGVLDAEALALGRIKGKNAAAATILKVQSIPTPADYDSYVSASAATTFDPIETLTDHFYVVLAELHQQVRAWEKSAEPGELMRPATMAEMWKRAIEACKKRNEPVTDAFGRELALWVLPEDLLALTAPRAVVIEGTRLPEDVENWSEWVRRNRP